MKYKEIEYKYRADEMSLTLFETFCRAYDAHDLIQASGYDHFYQSRTSATSFCRHRVGGDINQLTFKRKLSDSNNYIRTEHNLDLKFSSPVDQVAALVAEFGYKHNFSMFKNCFIYKFDKHIFVYYICYDTDMKELGRFFEIEMVEDGPWQTEEEAQSALNAVERSCALMGITPQSRIKRSLFEMFKK